MQKPLPKTPGQWPSRGNDGGKCICSWHLCRNLGTKIDVFSELKACPIKKNTPHPPFPPFIFSFPPFLYCFFRVRATDFPPSCFYFSSRFNLGTQIAYAESQLAHLHSQVAYVGPQPAYRTCRCAEKKTQKAGKRNAEGGDHIAGALSSSLSALGGLETQY